MRLKDSGYCHHHHFSPKTSTITQASPKRRHIDRSCVSRIQWSPKTWTILTTSPNNNVITYITVLGYGNWTAEVLLNRYLVFQSGMFTAAKKFLHFITQILTRNNGFVMRIKFMHIYIQLVSCYNNRWIFHSDVLRNIHHYEEWLVGTIMFESRKESLILLDISP